MSQIEDKLKGLLPEERFKHSLRVKDEALKLARRLNIDPKKAETAALLHDCARYLEGPQLVEAARKFKMKVEKIEEFEPKLLHARLSARIARRDFKISDPEVLSAIEKHTVGSEKMSDLEKVIYLADHIEAERDFKDVQKIRELAYRDPDAAIAASAGSMIRHLLELGQPIFEQTVRTRNHYLMKG